MNRPDIEDFASRLDRWEALYPLDCKWLLLYISELEAANVEMVGALRELKRTRFLSDTSSFEAESAADNLLAKYERKTPCKSPRGLS